MATYAYSTPAPEDGAHHRTRRAVEAYIDRLIALLDEIDGDPDLEDAADADAEPYLAQIGQRWFGHDDDREFDESEQGEPADENGEGEFRGGCLIGADRPGVFVIPSCGWRRT